MNNENKLAKAMEEAGLLWGVLTFWLREEARYGC